MKINSGSGSSVAHIHTTSSDGSTSRGTKHIQFENLPPLSSTSTNSVERDANLTLQQKVL